MKDDVYRQGPEVRLTPEQIADVHLWSPPRELYAPKSAAEEHQQRKRLEEAQRQWAEYKAHSDGGEVRQDVAHGICRGCAKRTQLWLPARICTKCLRKAAEEAGIDIDNPPLEEK